VSLRPSMDADRIVERLRQGDRLRKDLYGWGFSPSPSDWVDGRVVAGLVKAKRVDLIPNSGAYLGEVVLPQAPGGEA
jgi:hypothetical protein